MFCLYKTSKSQWGPLLGSAVLPKSTAGKGLSFQVGLSIKPENSCFPGGTALLMGEKKGGRDQFGAANSAKGWLK